MSNLKCLRRSFCLSVPLSVCLSVCLAVNVRLSSSTASLRCHFHLRMVRISLKVLKHHHNFSIILVGARVFARWTDKGYYRGFVNGTSYRGQVLYIDVQLDQLGSVSHQASDERAIVLDIIPLYNHVHATQRVIGCFPGYTSYLPGWVVRRNTACWEAAYHVLFDMGKERDQDFHELRVLPPYV